MEEQKKENQETEGTKKSFRDIVDNMPGRSVVLWCLAGFYLLYTGFTLCSDVIKGDGGIGFLLAGIVFLVIGGGLMFFGIRGRFGGHRKKEETAKAEAAEPEVTEEISEEPAEPRKMSISERAALASRIDEEPEE